MFNFEKRKNKKGHLIKLCSTYLTALIRPQWRLWFSFTLAITSNSPWYCSQLVGLLEDTMDIIVQGIEIRRTRNPHFAKVIVNFFRLISLEQRRILVSELDLAGIFDWAISFIQDISTMVNTSMQTVALNLTP